MKTKYIKSFFLIFLIQVFLFIACDEEDFMPVTPTFVPVVKTQANFTQTENNAFREVKSWYQQNVESTANARKAPRYLGWDGVVSTQLGPGDNWMFTVPIFDREALRKVKKLVMFSHEGQTRSFEMEITPEESYLTANGLSINENFSGQVKILSNSGRLIKNTTLNQGTLDQENGLNNLNGLSTLNFGGFDLDDPCATMNCLEEVIVVATPLPNIIWVLVPDSWQPTWDHGNTGTNHGQWNSTHLGWNVHIPAQSGPIKITKAMLQSMIDGLTGLTGAEKLKRIIEFFKELDDAYVTGATLREVLSSNDVTNKIKEIRKTGNTISIIFENEDESIEYPLIDPFTATLESDNSFLFDISDPTEIDIKSNGIIVRAFNFGLGSIGKMRINENGVFARKFAQWHTLIDFNAPPPQD